MSATIETIRDRFRLGADDVAGATWSDDAVEQWIYEAIHDFAMHVPPFYLNKITVGDGDNIVTVAQPQLRSIISVEWPVGDDPPTYLTRKRYTDPDFWLSDHYYDFIDRLQEAADNPYRL